MRFTAAWAVKCEHLFAEPSRNVLPVPPSPRPLGLCRAPEIPLHGAAFFFSCSQETPVQIRSWPSRSCSSSRRSSPSFLTLSAAPAGAAGGIAADGTSGKPGKAKLKKNGIAVPPANAPKRVVKAIEAANEIHRKPYVWGGGHGSFKDNGYDCSGARSATCCAAPRC